MLDTDSARRFADEWVAAWNSHDLDRVLAHYADDFIMSSPFIVAWMKEPTGTLRGKDQIRPYWTHGLAQSPLLFFTLERVFVGVRSLTLCYQTGSGKRVAEVLEFNDEGLVIRGSAHHAVE